MSSPGSGVKARPPRTRRSRVIVGAIIALAVVVVIAVGTFVVQWVISANWKRPDFASLAQQPDSSLQGTVAYFAGQSRCVRVVAAAGQPDKDVLCVGDQVTSNSKTAGKDMGPQLAWLPDGRLEVTMFRMNPQEVATTPPPGMHLTAGWRKIVDVRTGEVEDVPKADVPSQPDPLTYPTVSPSGERVSTTSDGGQTEVVLDDGSGPRTLLSFPAAPSEANYIFGPAFWAPNWDWIAASDGRILIITADDPSVTRVLRDDTGSVNNESWAEFAVTDQNLLTPAG